MPQIILSETPGPPGNCLHAQHVPVFNAEACRSLTGEQVREKYPMFHGECQACHVRVKIWASIEHLQALGD